PALRPYLADLAWLVLPLAPLINVLPLRLDSLVAERFLYLPSLGAAALLARGAYALEHTKLLRASLHVALCVGLALAFACVTVPRMQAFESDRALWLDELERNPRECYTMYRLANQAIVRKELRQALAISHAGYDQALRDRLRMYEVRFVLLSALSVLQIARDTDQGTLGALRDFYDAIAAGKPASLKLPMFTLSTRFGRELAPLVNEDILIFALPRAIAHARSGDLQGAQTLLEHAVVQAPTHGEAWEQLALVLARQRRFDQARAALSQGKGRVGDPTMLAAAAARVDRAQAVLALPAATPAQRSIHEAHAEIVLGGFARARELLDPELALEPGDAEVIHARTLVDAADQRYDLAHARIEALLRTDPARAGLWKQVLAEVDAIAVQNPAPTQ
ncbi:MAG TPA: tetratricopeptide repeat protein, partial [Polyangiales bacterium]|nr:tetratricopeptide repeat protein [Polyangiales bacterium]